MPTLAERLHLLLETGRPRRELAAAMISALQHAEPAEREPIAEALLTLDEQDGYEAVVRNLPRLATTPIPQMLERLDSPELVRALGSVVNRAPIRVQLASLAIIAKRSEIGLIENVAQLVDDSKDALPETAATTVLRMIEHHAGPRGRGRMAHPEMKLIDRAFADLLDRATAHRQVRALLAIAVLLPRAGAMVRERLEMRDHPGVMALRGVVSRTNEPLVRRNMIRWLNVEPLDRPVLRWMHRINSAAGFADLLDGAHLLLHPARRRAIRRVDRPMQCLPHLSDAVCIDERVQHRLPDVVMAMPISTSRRVGMLTDSCALPSPLARLRCVLALEGPAGSGSDAAIEALDRFTFDRDPIVSSVAGSRRLYVPEPPARSVLEQLEQRAEEPVASEASLRLARSCVVALMQRLDLLPANAARIAAMACLEREPDALVRQFAGQLGRSEPRAVRLRIIHLIRRLRIAAELTNALLSCTDDDDAHVASAATSALDAIHTRRVTDALKRLMRHHPVPRVRANAVEALSRLGSHQDRDDAELEPYSDSVDNRLRANAIRSMIDGGNAAALARLGVMLRDDRPLHRVSALWVARQVRAKSLVRTIRRVADEDASGEIRSRAARIARFLAAQRDDVPGTKRRGREVVSIAARAASLHEPKPEEMMAR